MKKIRKRTEYHSMVDADNQVRYKFKKGYQEYDDKDNLVRDVVYLPDGEIESATGFKFDDQNRLIEEIHYYEGGETGERISYELDTSGKRKSIETLYADGSVSLKKIERSDNMISVRSYDEDGQFESEEHVKYDDHGRVMEETLYDEAQQVETMAAYEYDEKGRLIARTDHGENREFIIRTEVEYDEHDRVISETKRSRKGELVDRTSFEFDDKGHQVALQNNRYLVLREYDDQGNVTREEYRNKVNNLVEKFTEYTYDPEGFLVEERAFTIGEKYDLQPGIEARTQSVFLVTNYEYEFAEE